MEQNRYYKKHPVARNNHHLIGKYNKNLFNVFDERNVVRMKANRHSCLHGLFQNLLTPKEQIGFMSELCEPVLSVTAKRLLKELLQLSDKEFYSEGLVRRK